MNYYILTFTHGNWGGHCEQDIPDETGNYLWDASSKIEDVLKKASLHVKHAYSFPGDDIYKYLSSALATEELRKQIDRLILEAQQNEVLSKEVHLVEIRKESPDSNPYKTGNPTLKEYMDES